MSRPVSLLEAFNSTSPSTRPSEDASTSSSRDRGPRPTTALIQRNQCPRTSLFQDISARVDRDLNGQLSRIVNISCNRAYPNYR